MARALIAALAAVPLLILLLPAFLAAGALWLFAFCVRGLGRLIEPRFVPWSGLMRFDRALGWKARSGVDEHYLADRDDVFRIVTDADGWPGTRSLDDSAMVVIGDSFAFGYGVDTGRSFADLNPSVPIKAVGAPGYCMVHGVLMLEQLASRLNGKLVVWFICLENDIQDNMSPGNWRYRAPFVRRSGPGWEIVDSHIVPMPWPCSDLGWTRIFPQFCVPGPLTDHVYAACDYLIGRAAACCRRAGAQLVLVTVPDPIQLTAEGRARLAALSGKPESCDVHLPDRLFAESCERHGVPIVVGMDHFTIRDYKRREALHWNKRGHRQMAAVLARLYESFRSGRLERVSVPVAAVFSDEPVRVASQ
jgi:hypothetical protein